MKSTRQYRRRQNQRYEDYPVDFTYCVYCNDHASTVDHVPAISRSRTHEGPLYRYPSCSLCNSLLSNLPHDTIHQRASYLLSVYKKRYKNLLNTPKWEEEELNEMGPIMRKEIETSLEEKEQVKLMLTQIERLTYL